MDKHGYFYEGLIKDDKKSGFGYEVLPGVGQYSGSLKNGVKHGNGKMTYISRETYKGVWVKN